MHAQLRQMSLRCMHFSNNPNLKQAHPLVAWGVKQQMNDLNKLKKELVLKYKIAKMENELEERFNGCFLVFSSLGRIHVCMREPNNVVMAAAVLNAYPSDTMIDVAPTCSKPEGEFKYSYRVRSDRGYADTYSTLTIQWISDEIKYKIELRIDGVDVLEQFFLNGQREISQSELSTYKPTRRNCLVRHMTLPIKDFLCENVSYVGGYREATDIDTINNIVETIKNYKQL